MEREIKILVPTDFSDCSVNALEYALKLADRINASILLFNVIIFEGSEFENIAFAVENVEERVQKIQNDLNKLVHETTTKINSSLNGIPSIRTNIEVGKVEATICKEASINQIDYIIMGTQGENSTYDKILGSVASNVLKIAPCPVLVIPENTEFTDKLVLGYATDFSDGDPFELWKAIKLFKSFQTEIKCVHFYEKQELDEHKIKELELYFAENRPELHIQFYNLPLMENKVADLNAFIEDHDVNIMVMYKLKRSFLESIFHKSYTQKMAKHSNIPLLVFKEGK